MHALKLRQIKLIYFIHEKKYCLATLSAEPREKEHIRFPTLITDIDKNSILSLSTIANALKDMNSESPRRLVNEIIMAQKRKKNLIREKSLRKETYTLPLERKSMLATSTTSSDKFDENSLMNLTKKLSLDSQRVSEVITAKEQIPKILSSVSSSTKEAESFTSLYREKMKEEIRDKNATLSFQDTGLYTSTSVT